MQQCTIYEYWKQTGAKFTALQEQFDQEYCNCCNQYPMVDEHNEFDTFLCTKDFNKCDRKCRKHHPPLNDDIATFFHTTCERFKNER